MVGKLVGWNAAAGAVGLLVPGFALYRRDMSRAYERVRGKSSLLRSRYGDIEYREGGAGAPVLVSHGSGGGFDQGELIARAFLDDRFHWIAPSRFGYLRSSIPRGATFDDQAHAYATLLDSLGIERVAVVAVSHGGPSALLFALLYPERVSSLALVSCGVMASATGEQGDAHRKGSTLATLFRYDWLYWGITRLWKRQFMELMGAPAAVIAGLTPEQRALVDRIIEGMNPVSPRAAGALFDNHAALPGERIAAIQAPTLIVHATDDTLQLFHNAQFAAEMIPGARLVRFERGGHLLMAVELGALRDAIQRHIVK